MGRRALFFILSIVPFVFLAAQLQNQNRIQIPGETIYLSLEFAPFTVVQALYVVLAVVQAVLYHLFVRRQAETDGGSVPKSVWIFAGVVLLAAAIVPPFTSADIYYYLGIGRIQNLHDLNPYLHSIDSVAGEPMAGEVYWSRIPTMYAPLLTAFFRIPTAMLGDAPLAQLALYRLLVLAACLGTAWAAADAARTLKVPASVVVAGFLASPLLLHEVVMNGHNEIFPLLALMTATALVLRGKWAGAFVMLVIAGFLKFTFLMAGPAFLAAGLRARGVRLWPALLSGAVATAALLAIARVMYFEDPAAYKSFAILGSLWGPSTPGVLAIALLEAGVVSQKGALTLTALFKPAFVVVVLIRAWRIRATRALVYEVPLAFAVFYAVFSTYVWPWYWTTLLPFLFLDHRRRLYAPALGVTIGSFLFWGYWNAFPGQRIQVAFPIQYLLFYGPLALALVPAIRRRITPSAVPPSAVADEAQ